MKLKSVIAIIIVFVSVMTSVKAETNASGGVLKLLNPDKTVNVGLMGRDTIAEGILLLHNGGTEPVSITAINTDCNCTKFDTPRDPIAPGDTLKLKVTFNSKGRVPGHFRKSFRIRSTAKNGVVYGSVAGRVAMPIRKE